MPIREPGLETSIDVTIDMRPEERDVTLLESANSAALLSNTLGSAANAGMPVGEYDPEFNLLDRVAEDDLQENFDYFILSRNEDDYRRRVEAFRREEAAREIDAATHPALSFGLNTAAAILDWPTLIPGGVVRGAGGRVATAARVGVAAGAGAAAYLVVDLLEDGQ